MSSTRAGSSAYSYGERDAFRCVVDGNVIRVNPGDNGKFEVVDDPPRAYTETPTAGKITGFGDRYETCGDEQPHFCSECGEPARHPDGRLVQIGETCWRQECPRCGKGWAMRRSVQPVSKTESLRKEIAERRGKSPRFHHVVVRLRDFRSNRDPDDAYFQVAKAAIREVGVNVFGGTLIHHPYSGNQEEDDDLDQWKERLFSDRDWEGDVEDELEECHHVHALVLADSIDYLSCEALEDRTGILVHRIENNDEDSSVSLYGVEDLSEATTYCFSHARWAEDADAYRYFGEVANHSADHRVEARCREVVRSVVPKTLDLQPAGYLCSREIGREEVDKLPNIQQGQYDNDDSDDQDEQTDDTEDAREDTDTEDDSTQDSTEAAESDEQTDEGDGSEETEDDAVAPDTDADDDTEDNTSNTTEDSNDGCGVHCNGRLVPFEYAPSFLDDDEQELEYEDELRAAYDDWNASDNEDITSFVAPD